MQSKRTHLPFLDGIRALAALWVVASHAYTLAVFNGSGRYTSEVPDAFRQATHLLCYGYHGVPVFIVLSGFLLMLPVVTAPQPILPGGFWSFMKRRARRILPPYYAALAIYVPVLFLGHAAKRHIGMAAFESDFQINASPGSIGSHLLLIHNWWEQWNKSIDGPMWSVAAEWQIYILFGLILLPLWRRAGNAVTVSVAFLFGIGLLSLLPADRNLYWTCPWYVGLFALGMWGASIAFARPGQRRRSWLRTRFPWYRISVVLAALLLGVAQFALPLFQRLPVPFLDTIIGIGTVSLMIACTITRHAAQPADDSESLAAGAGAPAWVPGMLESRLLSGFAAFSYSTYLLHYPILVKLTNFMGSRGVGYRGQLLVQFLVGVPVVITFSYLFYLAFEKRFQRSAASRRTASPGLAPQAQPLESAAPARVREDPVSPLG